jgi:hypothetical protein
MIGWLASKVFMMGAKAEIKNFQENPKVHNAVHQYKKDTDEFKKRIDDLGIGSFEDLIAATKKNPNVADLESPRDRKNRIRKELGL